MNQRTVIILVLILVGVVIALVTISIGITMALGERGVTGDRIALIKVEGVITSGGGNSSLFGDGSAGAEYIVDLLEKFRKDRGVRSLVLRINSPGGSAAGSQEIYHQVLRVRKDGKKVIVSMGDVAASGGYYIAAAADRIYADPATLTGSIGVIFQTADIHELLEKLGVDMNTIKSGKHKDIGSFSRSMTPEERAILQRVIDDVFDQFVSDVSSGRNIPKKKVLAMADGRIYTGRQAVELGLVDRIGGLQDAMKAAARDAGIKGDFSVVEYGGNPGLLDILFGTKNSKLSFSPETSPLAEFARQLLRADLGLAPNRFHKPWSSF